MVLLNKPLKPAKVQELAESLITGGDAEIEAYLETYFSALDPWVSGKYYDIGMMDSLGSNGSVAIVADTLYATLIKIPYSLSIDRLACHITTGAAAGKLVRLGLYENGADNLPGDLIVDGGTVAADVTSTTVTATVNQTLARGRYWVAAVSDGTPTLSYYSAATAGRFLSGLTAIGHGTSGRSYTVKVAHAFGALPATFGAAAIYAINVLRLGVRVA